MKPKHIVAVGGIAVERPHSDRTQQGRLWDYEQALRHWILTGHHVGDKEPQPEAFGINNATALWAARQIKAKLSKRTA